MADKKYEAVKTTLPDGTEEVVIVHSEAPSKKESTNSQ